MRQSWTQYINTVQKVKLSEIQLKRVFSCPVDGCSHSFSRRYNLQRHLKSLHGDEHVASTSAGRFVCHIKSCGEQFYHASKMIQHYKMKHGTHISEADHCIYTSQCHYYTYTCTVGTDTKQFPSWEAFMSWKDAEEESTYTCFVQPKGGVSSKSEDLGAQPLIY